MVPDLIDLDVEETTYRGVSTPTAATTPSSPSKIWPMTPGFNASGLGIGPHLEQDIKVFLEQDIKVCSIYYGYFSKDLKKCPFILLMPSK